MNLRDEKEQSKKMKKLLKNWMCLGNINSL